MPGAHLFTRLLVVASALVASSVAADAQSSAPLASRQTRPASTSSAFEGSVADVTAAIRDAGGTVLDVNDAIGVALVSSSDSAFLNKVGPMVS